jgi:hypothetical protein
MSPTDGFVEHVVDRLDPYGAEVHRGMVAGPAVRDL